MNEKVAGAAGNSPADGTEESESTMQPDTSNYAEFLASKALVVPSVGRDIPVSRLHPDLFPFQRALVSWSLRKGRAALFATTGMGKTLMQLAWAQHAAERVLILAPLAVAQQTVREGERFGIAVTYARSQADSPETGITIANYEMLGQFDAGAYGAVVLDESGILKSFDGKTRTQLIRTFQQTPMRLACTATPAPNDIAELANHAEFLGIMSRVEMLATFFVHDEDGWRLKGHARDPFYRWLASWSMTLRRPSDLGYDDAGFALPDLSIRLELVRTDWVPPGQLFPTTLKGITERSAVRKDTIAERVAAAVRIVQSEPDEAWLIWCGLNDEGRELAAAIPGAVLVEGADAPESKASALLGFADGHIPAIVTKARIAGYGMNFQRCARMIFVGLGDSFEQYFQAIRRCWRFGQTRPVVAYIVLTEPEEPIYQNVLRKEREFEMMGEALVEHVAQFERAEIGNGRGRVDYQTMQTMVLPSWLRRAS